MNVFVPTHSVGKEFGCGIYVSSVLPSSKAAQQGLKVYAYSHFEVRRCGGYTCE